MTIDISETEHIYAGITESLPALQNPTCNTESILHYRIDAWCTESNLRTHNV